MHHHYLCTLSQTVQSEAHFVAFTKGTVKMVFFPRFDLVMLEKKKNLLFALNVSFRGG